MPTTPTTPESTTAPSSPKKLPHRTYTVRGQKRALLTLGTGEHSKLMDVPFALLDIAASGQPSADSYLVEEGLRKVDAWTCRYRLATVAFSDQPFDPFFNANRLDDLDRATALLGVTGTTSER